MGRALLTAAFACIKCAGYQGDTTMKKFSALVGIAGMQQASHCDMQLVPDVPVLIERCQHEADSVSISSDQR